MNNHTLKIIFLIISYFIYIHFLKGYYTYLPTIPIYPNNLNDIHLLKKEINNRNLKDINLFFNTNHSVVTAFKPYVTETNQQLENIATSHNFIILFFKYLINRRRPYQIDQNIYPLSTITSQTPSYPAGHAYQAILLATHLSKKYPHKKQLFHQIALDCDICRVRAGIHYITDGQFSRTLFKFFSNIL